MKIIFLNALGGQIANIKQFVLDQSKDTDVFCFQESCIGESPIFCLDWLKDYRCFFDKKRIDGRNAFTNCTLVRKNYSVLDIVTVGQGEIGIGLGLVTRIEISRDKTLNLGNVHGYAQPGDKLDNPARIRQSKLIIDYFKDLTGPKIIGGDFNLDINTKSVLAFEQNGYINLIKEYKIPTTRNEVSWSRYKEKQLFADYVFTSSEIKVKSFLVPDIVVSDHLPIILDLDMFGGEGGI